MNLVAHSFAWPFHGRWRSSWGIGLVTVLLLPLLFVPLLGYTIAAVREAQNDPRAGPPAWKPSWRLITDGLWTALAIALATLPFAVLYQPIASFFFVSRVWTSSDAAVAQLDAHVLGVLLLAMPWGLGLLLFMPHATARFARSGRAHDLLDLGASVRDVRSGFLTWNLAAAAIVTAWAVGIACAGLLCIGLVPGMYYAILVSAHACAALDVKGPNPSPG